jgi:hypothetical protein
MEKNKVIKEKKEFHISAKKLFLTYSQINMLITKEIILEELQRILNCEFKFKIALEKHVNGGMHAHVFLEGFKKFNIKTPNRLDLFDKIHGKYESVKNKEFVIAYIIKDDFTYF